jgi:hypothetical protein
MVLPYAIVFERTRASLSMAALAHCLSMILSENRFPPRINCGAGFFGIMLWSQTATAPRGCPRGGRSARRCRRWLLFVSRAKDRADQYREVTYLGAIP